MERRAPEVMDAARLNYRADKRLPLCQRPVRQSPLETYVPMGGDWTYDCAETHARSRERRRPGKRAA
jgi:hypothetical protein